MRKSIAVAAALLVVAVPATGTAAPAAEPAQPSATAQAAYNAAANQFMDQVMLDMHSLVPRSGLDPLRAAPFKIKVKGNGSTSRNLKADFTQGAFYGLASLSRQGDCSYGTFGAGMKMGCYIALQPVAVLMNAEVNGDSSSGGKHAISTSTSVAPHTLALVEIQGQRGYQARLDHITIKAVIMTTSVTQGRLDLNTSRFNDFVKQTNQNLSDQLTTAVNGVYAQAMQTVLTRHAMP